MPFDKRKAFGQHFLQDQSVIQAIVAAVVQATRRHPEAAVLEIGPGQGAITRPLLQSLPLDKKFYLAERDRELIAEWRGESRVTRLIEGDFVRVSDDELSSLGPLIVVSNLPYSAGTAIVVRLCERAQQIAEMVLMFQSEVAKRLRAAPSTPDRGSLSLYIQNEWDVKTLIEVEPAAFRPPPKVMSEVVTLARRDVPLVDVRVAERRSLWNDLLKLSFQHRRKMLKGNLSKPPFKEALEKSGVDVTYRAEALTWDHWKKIWAQLGLFLAGGATLMSISNFAHADPFSGEMISPSDLHSEITRGKKYTLELGIEYLHPMFGTMSQIVVENTTISTSNQTTDLVQAYPDELAQILKFQMLANERNRLSFSIKSYLPLNSLAQLDTGYIYQPEFVLYRSESQRPRVQVGVGIDLADDVRVGVGADVGFAVTTNANVFLQNGTTNGVPNYSDQRLSATIKPSVVPQFSVAVSQFQFVVKGENKVPFQLNTNAGAAVFSGGAGVSFAYASNSALYFDPWSFELHGRHSITSVFKISWGVAYQLWSGYQARAATIVTSVQNNCNGNSGCSTVFSPTQSPSFTGRNLFVPQAGLEYQLGDNRYEIGYRYKDSIFAGLPTGLGVGNYLDPPRHDIWVGATFPLSNGWEWGADVQVSQLVSQTVVKSVATDIGGPSYTASGWLLGGAARLVIPF